MIRFFILFFFSLLFNSFAQKSLTPKTYNTLKNSALNFETKGDTIYNLLLNALSKKETGLDSLSNDFRRYSEKQNSRVLRAYSHLFQARMDKVNDDLTSGITNILKGIDLLDTIEQRKDLCSAYQLLAGFYTKTNNFQLASAPTLKALKIAEELNNSTLLFDAYSAIGIGYIREKKFNEAMLFYRKALGVAVKSNNDLQLTKIYTNIGIAFRNQKKWDSALFYHTKSLQLAKKINETYNIAFALNDIGVIYLNLEEYDKALNYLLQSASMREVEGEKYELGFTYNFIAECYINIAKYNECENFIRKAIQISYLSKNVRQRYESYEYMSVLNQLQNRYDSAYFYMQKYTFLKDSFQRARNNFSTDALVASYKFDEKEKEIRLLNETAKNQQLKIQKQQLYLTSIAIGIILIVIILVLIIRTRQQKSAKILLEAKLKEEAVKREADQKLQAEKERISRDLHDNVGGQLSYILYSIDGIEENDATKRLELKTSINESVRGVIQNLRETIWAINDEKLTLNDLSDKLKVYARAMFKHTSVKLNFKENIQKNVFYNSLTGLNLYRICQEILNNAFKYSQASQILIEISSSEKTTIMISDNGVGFDASNVKEGFGLNNIKKRAHEIEANVSVVAKPNEGVSITLVV